MDKTFKRQLMTYLDTGHRHPSMTEMTACSYCGERFKKGEELYNRMRREKPELFKYKAPEYERSEELEEMYQQHDERKQHDSLYQKHIDILKKDANPEEVQKEIDKSNEGFYRKHSNWK